MLKGDRPVTERVAMDKTALTKEKAIWIAIRILGVTFALKVFISVFRLASSLITTVFIGAPPYLPSTLIIQLMLFQTILTDCVIIFITIYLLFFAKRVYGLIDKSTPAQDENTCQSTLIATITVRTFGVWFIIRGIIKLFDYTLMVIDYKIMDNRISKGIEDGSVSSNEAIEKILNFGIPKVTITLIVTVLGCAIAAFYFLKYGKLIIRLLTRKV